jgi:hypothetical protein
MFEFNEYTNKFIRISKSAERFFFTSKKLHPTKISKISKTTNVWFLFFLFSACYELQFPKNFTSLSEDLRIQLVNISWPPQGSRDNDSIGYEDFAVIDLLTDPNAVEPRAYTKIRIGPQGAEGVPHVPVAIFPCYLLFHGGRYWLRYSNGASIVPLDVRWYNASLTLDPNTPAVMQVRSHQYFTYQSSRVILW